MMHNKQTPSKKPHFTIPVPPKCVHSVPSLSLPGPTPPLIHPSIVPFMNRVILLAMHLLFSFFFPVCVYAVLLLLLVGRSLEIHHKLK